MNKKHRIKRILKLLPGLLLAGALLTPAAALAADDPAIAHSGEWEGLELAPGIKLGVLTEVEATYEKTGDEETSDIAVSALEIGLSADPAEGIHAEAVLYWEQDEDVEFDVAFVSLGGTEKIPVRLDAGWLYAPLGRFESLMLSDPLTLELGETREAAAGLAYVLGPVELWAGAFNGQLDREDDTIDNGVAALTVTPCEGLQFGASFSSDIGEGSGYLDDLNDLLAVGGDVDRTPAVSAWLRWDIAKFSLSAEYLGAVDDLEWTTPAGEEGEGGETVSQNPQAWFIDAGYAFTDEWSAALRYEGSSEFKPEEWPEARYGGAVVWQFHPLASIGAEYLYGTFEDSEDEDAPDDSHLVTLKLALEF